LNIVKTCAAAAVSLRGHCSNIHKSLA